jgi:protein AroM
MQGEKPVIAAVTIGQAPRPDLLDEIALLVPGATWIETGALDGLTDAEVGAFAPAAGEMPLVTRARGRTVLVGGHAIAGPVRRAIREAAPKADAVLLLCSGPFEALGSVPSKPPIVIPGRVFDGVVTAVAGQSRLVVMVPHEGQAGAQRRKWNAAGIPVSVLCAPPYADTDFAALGRRAAECGDLVAMDCIGYSLAQRTAVAAASGLPTLLARSVAGRVLAELLGLHPPAS